VTQQSKPKQPWFRPPQRLPDDRIGYPAGPTEPPKLPGAPGSGQGAGGSGGGSGGTDGPPDAKRPRPDAEAGQPQQTPGQPSTSTSTSSTSTSTSTPTSQDRPQASTDRLDNFLLAHPNWRNEDIARVVGVTPNEVDNARHRLSIAGGAGTQTTTGGTSSTGAGSKKMVSYAGFQMTEALRDTIVEHARRFRRQADKVMGKWYHVPPEAIAELRRAHGVPKSTHHEANIPATLWRQVADDARLHPDQSDRRIAARHQVPESLVVTIRQQEGIGRNPDRRLTPARLDGMVAFIRAHVNDTDVSIAKTLKTTEDTIRKLRRRSGLPRLSGPSVPLTEARKLAIRDSMTKHPELTDYDIAKRYNISMETVGRLRHDRGYAETPALPPPPLPAQLPAYSPEPARPGQPPVPVGSAASPSGQQQAETQSMIQWMADHLSENELKRIIDLPEQEGQAELAKIRQRMSQPEQGTAPVPTPAPSTSGSPDAPAPAGKPTAEAPAPTASTATASTATRGSPDAPPPSPREVQLQGAWNDLNWIDDNYANNRKLIDWMARNLSDQQLQWFLDLPLDQVETAAEKIRQHIGLPDPAAGRAPAATSSRVTTSGSDASSSPPSSPREERRQRLQQELDSSPRASFDTEDVVDWLLTHRTQQQLDRLDQLTDAEFDVEMDRIRKEMYQ
jgi:hypothetical protein